MYWETLKLLYDDPLSFSILLFSLLDKAFLPSTVLVSALWDLRESLDGDEVAA